ncbi:TPA: hypothetical protein EYP38_01295 [Candidatus Micrarchaeota archaeon]|nr:hypothetical protein [Candidatus Micrarchaeota archaeon]
MVDICTSVEGCLGAQILGAGLGGCTMTLARKEAIEEVRRRLVEQYYEPRELPPDAWDVYPGEGAQVLKHA